MVNYKSALLLGCLSLLLVVGGLALRQGQLLLLAVPLVVFWLVGLYRRAGQPALQLDARRTLSARRVPGGARVQVTLEVINRGARTDVLRISDRLPAALVVVDGATSIGTPARPREVLTLNYEVLAPRGLHQWEAIDVIGVAHLAAGARSQTIPCRSTLWSLPRTESAKSLTMKPRRTRVFSGQIMARRGGEGLEFFDTREYVPGDEIRHIHWKATARTGKWITIQYEQERIADVGIVLDARAKSNVNYADQAGPDRAQPERHALFEHSIRAAASLAEMALAQGNRVGLLTYGRALEWTYPGYGARQRERIFQALAQAKLGKKVVFEGLEYFPKKLFPLRSQLIFVSPVLGNDVDVLKRLRAHGYFVTVISPNPVWFEAGLLPDNTVVRVATRLALLERHTHLQSLRRGGVVVVDWDMRRPLHPQMLRALAWVRR